MSRSGPAKRISTLNHSSINRTFERFDSIGSFPIRLKLCPGEKLNAKDHDSIESPLSQYLILRFIIQLQGRLRAARKDFFANPSPNETV